MLRKLLKRSAFVVYSLAFAWVLFFLLIETFPGILDRINLRAIKYYAVKTTYISDPNLLFVYRNMRLVKRRFTGSSYSPEYGQPPPPPIDYLATYDAEGFRSNSSARPYEVAVIGDSFIELGESDSDTFAELLSHESGKSVENLGRAWYGPYQYLEVLKRYALKEKPKFILFCFFAGNDFDDLTNYENWKATNQYYFYDGVDRKNIASRFIAATRDTVHFLAQYTKRTILRLPSPPVDLTRFGIIQLGEKKVPMSLLVWEREVTVKETDSLRSVMLQFKELCEAEGIVPIVVYIPFASQVYAEHYSSESNPGFVERAKRSTANPSLDAVTQTSRDAGIRFLNLLPVFKREAEAGKLLYYPYDTHWNVEGRQVAASFVASQLDNASPK